ncbi:[FeFe] hydrogenase, group A [Tenuifilum thalassicum]|uniref:2Fe-2S iron-sulfur cluster binding domain-containing protein n=1 Tax=Tenuifilum thalassicum TaxID=2590900 RepID=A0A7D3XEV1_9BACT|nr:[FeFe] hydrogenase, group A [Tenuifilum thalassicum]QKG80267.1 2Fe-2S iron-sulfur cluster binding domain-containing protein [Tenuifilum thalassicum]
MNITIEVNNRSIKAKKGDTILEALRQNGIRVPTLCNMAHLTPTGACRLCVVEVEGYDNLLTSCSHIVEEGMKIKTHSPRVVRARKTIVELLLDNHPDDCLYCEKNGSCELQDLAVELHVRERKVLSKSFSQKLDLSSPSIVRDPAKCILCGRCVRICDEVQSVSTFEFIKRGCNMYVGTTMSRDLNFSNCIGCGQCVLVCPTGALTERQNIAEVIDAINNPEIVTVAQIAPSISVSIASEFGMKATKDINGIIYAALRKIGFDYVFDTSVAADISSHEMAQELLDRKENGESIPMLSSCCPAWVKFVEQWYPNRINLLSAVKSPQQIMGSLVRNYFSKTVGINPSNIFSVSIMPCLAKKFEAQREEMTTRGLSDVDSVISTRELVRLIKLYGIDMQNIETQHADKPFNIRSSAGKLFGISGGAAEAIARMIYFRITSKELVDKNIKEERIGSGVKAFSFKAAGHQFRFAIVNGLKNIHEIIGEVLKPENEIDFVEVMACPGGCVNGGGQPFTMDEKSVKQRAKIIAEIDEADGIKCAAKNPSVHAVYEEFLEDVGSEKSKKFLYTRYSPRDVLL